MNNLDPFALAERQLELDNKRCQRFLGILPRKRARMRASPLAFLRGTAPLFYEILQHNDDLQEGPTGVGWIVGDVHLENFGAYKPAKNDEHEKRRAVFDLNDFDEAVVAPLHWDVLRLCTSIILSGRELGVEGPLLLSLAQTTIEHYCRAAFDEAPLSDIPGSVLALLDQVQKRSKNALLDARTEIFDAESGKKERCFQRGSRYLELSPDLQEALPFVFSEYIKSIPQEERPHHKNLELIDCAFRVAGTGSLGALRISVLTAGNGGIDGGFVFDLKELLPPSAFHLYPQSKPPSAKRCVQATRACLTRPPHQLGITSLPLQNLAPLGLVGRRLTPQEDKLELSLLARGDLPTLAAYLGGLLGAAHVRGQSSLKSDDLVVAQRWSDSDKAEMLKRAAVCAGLHEAVYLAFCLLSQEP